MQTEQTIRLSAFIGVLLLVAVWEIIAPRRPLLDNKSRRWFINLSIVFIDTVTVRLLFPILPVALAQIAATRGWGLFNILVMPLWSKILLSILILDFIIYLQHVMFHYLPTLWRLHRMHHTDLDLDVTTGNRFHPLEIVISMFIKLTAVVILGAPALAVLSFEVVLNACSMFSHGNVKLPATADRLLRLFLVTPDMHRVHHSTIVRETNSNFGFNLPWWDRLLGTYRPQPEKGHMEMTIGLKEYRDPQRLTLPRLLIQPFTSP
ncbi:MAG: sterol desaturase family protein [Geobacteraceae bacterium]|nr:sterol desaturase family protein [Geobacteraceae bacterium]NTW78704.1 sterol desaturase family protein [Geobacteraceae bacterium]